MSRKTNEGNRQPGAPTIELPTLSVETDDLDTIVAKLCANGVAAPGSVLRGPSWALPPSRETIIEIVESLRSVLFPGYFGTAEMTRESFRYHVGATLDRVVRLLREQIKRGLCFYCVGDDSGECPACEDRAENVTRAFLSRLPAVQAVLASDVIAAYEGDPAAASPDEAVYCYPGLRAITSFRIAHEIFRLGVPLIPRIITEHAHSVTGIDIHPGAVIGENLFIDHGTGVVVGETCEIGDRVRIYQGVTLGAKSFPLDDHGNPVKGVPRHPLVEDDVVIYAGATILGRVTIGRGSVIGGNVWLTRNVPPGSRISQAQVRSELFSDGGGI